MKTFTATQKFIRISPKKMREVVAMVKKMAPEKAIKVLPFIGKRGSLPLAKVIKTAIANAKQKDIDVKDLFFVEIQVGEGPRLKRGTPASRGQWHPILKRMSHIRVVLGVNQSSAVEPKVKNSSDKSKIRNTKEEKK